MRDGHETSSDEPPLDRRIERSLGAFHPDVRRIGRRYLPMKTLHGELLFHACEVLSDGATGRRGNDGPVETAVGIELFRAYGLTRELPAHEEDAVDEVPAILAGDQFLSTSFDRVGREAAAPPRVVLAIERISTTVRRFCALRYGDETGAEPSDRLDIERPGGRDGVGPGALVTPMVAGVLAVDLSAVLTRGVSRAPGPLRAAGASIGAAIECRRRRSSADVDRHGGPPDRHGPGARMNATGWSRDGANPYRTLDDGGVCVDHVCAHLDDARRELENAAIPVSEPFSRYLDRIGRLTSEPI